MSVSNKLHVKKGDTVVVLSGKDKGKTGKIIEALPKKEKIVVEGVNKVKRHTKPSQKNASRRYHCKRSCSACFECYGCLP